MNFNVFLVSLALFQFSHVFGLQILQISDIHVSLFDESPSSVRLKSFCFELAKNPPTEPTLLVLSGDMVHGSAPITHTMNRKGQISEEWNLLRDATSQCLTMQNVYTVAVRGNHDCAGVSEYFSHSNRFYIEYHNSLKNHLDENSQKDENAKNYSIKLMSQFEGTIVVKYNGEKQSDNVLFVFLDSCSNTGVSQELLGRFPTNLLNWLLEATKPLLASVENVIIFSHYPIGSYAPVDRKRMWKFFDSLKGKLKSYHSGHLHSLLGYPVDEDRGFFMEYQIPDFLARNVIRKIHGTNWDRVTDIFVSFTSPESVHDSLSNLSNNAIIQTGQVKFFRRLIFSYLTEIAHLMMFFLLGGTFIAGLLVRFVNTSWHCQFGSLIDLLLILTLLMPVVPLCLSRITVDSIGVQFYWGSVTFENKEYFPNDYGFEVTSLCVMGNAISFIAVLFLILSGRSHFSKIIIYCLYCYFQYKFIDISLYRTGCWGLVSIHQLIAAYFLYQVIKIHFRSAHSHKNYEPIA